MAATSASFFGLSGCDETARRSRRMSGLWRTAFSVGMKRTAAARPRRPPEIQALPVHWPGWRVDGRDAGEGGDLPWRRRRRARASRRRARRRAAARRREWRRGDSPAGARVSGRRRCAGGDGGLDLGDLAHRRSGASARRADAEKGAARACVSRWIKAVAIADEAVAGGLERLQLPPSRRAASGSHGRQRQLEADPGQHPGIDSIGLGASATCLGEAASAQRIDLDERPGREGLLEPCMVAARGLVDEPRDPPDRTDPMTEGLSGRRRRWRNAPVGRW